MTMFQLSCFTTDLAFVRKDGETLPPTPPINKLLPQCLFFLLIAAGSSILLLPNKMYASCKVSNNAQHGHEKQTKDPLVGPKGGAASFRTTFSNFPFTTRVVEHAKKCPFPQAHVKAGHTAFMLQEKKNLATKLTHKRTTLKIPQQRTRLRTNANCHPEACKSTESYTLVEGVCYQSSSYILMLS